MGQAKNSCLFYILNYGRRIGKYFVMIQKLDIEGVTVFPKQTSLSFVPGINMIVGGNDSGKSHLLKLAYITTKWTRRLDAKLLNTPQDMESGLARDVMRVFGTAHLSGTIAQYKSNGRARVSVQFSDSLTTLSAQWQRGDSDSLKLAPLDRDLPPEQSIFITPKEVLSLYPCYMEVGKEYPELLDGASWDLCCALEDEGSNGGSLSAELLRVKILIERLLGGRLRRKDGRFYLHRVGYDLIELNLIAEGFKRLGMLGLLIGNGRITQGCTLFWDEPEMNLNARHLPVLVEIMLGLCQAGVQIMLSTHSLFFLRELHLQLSENDKAEIERRYFGLQAVGEMGAGVRVSVAGDLDEMEPLESMKAEIAQADRYLMMGLSPHDAEEDSEY